MSLGFTPGEPLRSPEKSLSLSQLEAGSIYLAQVFSGLVALIQINPQNLDSNTKLQLSDRLQLSPHSPAWQPLTPSEMAGAIEILSHLCQQHQELIRRAVSLIEQMTQEGKDPWQVTLLKEYNQRWLARDPDHQSETDVNRERGIKILLDLLFYSSPSGQSRLWLRCTQVMP